MSKTGFEPWLPSLRSIVEAVGAIGGEHDGDEFGGSSAPGLATPQRGHTSP